MSFLLTCPNCGRREVEEFSFRGQYRPRPAHVESFEVRANYVFFETDHEGKRLERWYHSSGCRRWFLVERDNNADPRSFWFSDLDRP
ncbi:MAG: sarcosine oxidase subunit delta [Proteobacteria bacterium]|nr:sarcosine oxidase subunit delta [Pseudomonadota bacterium]